MWRIWSSSIGALEAMWQPLEDRALVDVADERCELALDGWLAAECHVSAVHLGEGIIALVCNMR